MQGSTIFSTIDLRDGFYQILMRDKDIPYTAVSTPSGMLWEWLVMPQGLSNAPATFNRCVLHLMRSVREFAPSYFDDLYIHSKTTDDKSDVEMHRIHLRKVLVLMREHKLYANIQKCLIGLREIPVLGCFVGINGVRIDPEKIVSIENWPTPTSQKDLRKFLGLSTYLHKYSKNYAELAHPLSTLLKKDVEWKWFPEHNDAFNGIKLSLVSAPVLMIADHSKPFHVVCDASDYAIGCALMQHDNDGRERVISYQSRQLKPAERNYPVHDKELLAMKYALTKFRIYLLGEQHFIVYTYHASLRTAIKTPHLSQRMARWLSFFAEYNFTVEYKPGKMNILADALSRRPDYESGEQANNIAISLESELLHKVKDHYKNDPICSSLISYFKDKENDLLFDKLPSPVRASIHRYTLGEDDLLYYPTAEDDTLRVLVPDIDDLKHQLVYEYHNTPVGGHLGREKTYLNLSRDFYWNRMYKWVRKHVRTCEICQRVKPSPCQQAPLRSLPVASDCWKSMSMDFIFGFPKDALKNTGILVFVDRFSKMVHLVAVRESISAEQSARVFLDTIFRHHGMPDDIISDRDPRFTAKFFEFVFKSLGTRLRMSTADHPQTDGQTERVNRMLEDILRSYATSFIDSWSSHLPMAEFAINNSVHVSTGYTPFYLNTLRHPRIPVLLSGVNSNFSGGETQANVVSTDVTNHIVLQGEENISPKRETKFPIDSIPIYGMCTR